MHSRRDTVPPDGDLGTQNGTDDDEHMGDDGDVNFGTFADVLPPPEDSRRLEAHDGDDADGGATLEGILAMLRSTYVSSTRRQCANHFAEFNAVLVRLSHCILLRNNRPVMRSSVSDGPQTICSRRKVRLIRVS